MGVSNYQELDVWQRAMDLAEEIYKLVKLLPKEETYSLSDQMRRAAVSIVSNIAEGNARQSRKEYLYFLRIAKGSIAELETQILLCQRIKYMTQEQTMTALNLVERVAKMISALGKALRTQ